MNSGPLGVFTTYAGITAHLDGLGLFHMDRTLERVRGALGRLGLERAPFPVAQVVGTNGKGSTSVFLASLAKAHGLRVGLYTSPHFVSPAERIRINGDPLPPQAWLAPANAVHQAEPTLTYFEFLTVLAVLAFAQQGVDLAVMEAGLGGRWDATTALHADLLCVAPIDMDHEAVLGRSLTAIAEDKAGAMRPGETVILGVQRAEASRVLMHAAEACGASARAASSLAPLPAAQGLGLRGGHQRHNAQLALAAWRALAQTRGWKTDLAKESRGLRAAFLPGRFQYRPAGDGLPPLLLDGAHNPHGMLALEKALRDEGISPSAVIFSCMADKDVAALAPCLRRITGQAPLLTPAISDNSRAARAEELAPRLSPAALPAPALADALHAVRAPGFRRGEGPALICGSLYLLGEFFTMHPECLSQEESS